MGETKPDSGLRVAFLVKEIAENAGQTRGIVEIVRYLHRTHPDWAFTIFTHQAFDLSFLPDFVDVRGLKGYYVGLLGYSSLSLELRGYDVAYVKGSFPYLTPAIRAGLPAILVVHHMDNPWFIHGGIGKLKTVATNFLFRFMIKRANTVLTVTDELARFYAKHYGVKPVVVEEIIGAKFYGVESERRNHYLEGGGRLLSVGYWDGLGGRKRQHLLFGYLRSIADSYPEIHLTLAGLGDRSVVDLQAIANRQGVGDRVTLLGVLSEDELVAAYQSSDVYVTATTYEGFYRQAVEAFATGMPLIGFDSRSIVEDPSQAAPVNHVLNSRGGELFTDSATFTDALRKIITDYPGYSSRAKAYAKRFTAEVVGHKTEELLVSLSRRATDMSRSSSDDWVQCL